MADQIAGPRSSRNCLSPGTVAGAPAVGVGDPDHRRRGDPRRVVPGAPGRVRRRDARGGRPLPGVPGLDTFLAGAADASLRVTEVSGVVHDVPLHGFVIGGYTRDGDAEPGSRCKSDTVLATVTRELEPHVATGPTGLGRRGESARPGSQDIACIVV
jgi:hypothetical protein